MSASASELTISATRWNARLLGAFGPILILTGLGGFLLPSRFALLSGAAPYDLFHLFFGALGTALVLARNARGVAIFNLAFGLGDLYQAAAGMLGLFPARLFHYRPGDHLAHLVLGLLLAVVGWWGLRPGSDQFGASTPPPSVGRTPTR
ncbi:MAG TPA: hypothetical protein VH853_24130 [Polyangia bacterium]|jgi:hypothetical protein|nr:hypothetical protein [Polyangia bacterium]